MARYQNRRRHRGGSPLNHSLDCSDQRPFGLVGTVRVLTYYFIGTIFSDSFSVRYINITQDGEPYLTLQLLLGYICYPVAFFIGIPREDLRKVGELIGTKIITNEFVAFTALRNEAKYLAMSPRSQIIATYALCGKHFLIRLAPPPLSFPEAMRQEKYPAADIQPTGFGNFGSLGVQIGVLSQLAPGRAGDVARVALSALFCGILSTLTSASIAGMLVTHQQNE